MHVLITLHNNPEPIKAHIPNYNPKEFTDQLNKTLLFIDLGPYIISRNMIQMIAPDHEKNGTQE